MTLPVMDVSPVTRVLKALSDDNRLKIVALLAQNELCVCHLVEALGLSQPNVSQHLTVLKNAGLVSGERRGTWMYYRLEVENPELIGPMVESILASCQLLSASEARQQVGSLLERVRCE